jgi:hypothetical protein
MFTNWNTQYYKDVNFPKSILQIYCKSNQNPIFNGKDKVMQKPEVTKKNINCIK